MAGKKIGLTRATLEEASVPPIAPPISGSSAGSAVSSRPAMRSAVSFARGSGLETTSA